MIPFLDLHKVNARFEAQFKMQFQEFLDSGWYILGKGVQHFEEAYAAYCGTKYCIGVGNGLDALRLIIEGYKALNRLQDGDEVLIAGHTYIATLLAVKQAGLKPVLVDIDPKTFNFDLTLLERAITPKTKAILPVHIYGGLAPMEAINAFAKAHKLLVIEDAAQAHGAVAHNGRKAGNLSDAAGFSFYPTKNLGALGDGGAITTNDDALATVIRKLRNYGTSSKYVNDLPGFNSRLDEVQALFLYTKLQYLDTDNTRRQTIAKRYLEGITNSTIQLPAYDGGIAHVFHLFVIQVTKRAYFIDYLTDNGVGSMVHYPKPPHHQEAFSSFAKLSLPETEKLHQQVVSLPMSPVLTDEEVDRIIQVVNAYPS